MYVCLCKGLTDRDIRRAARDGVTSLRELRVALGCASQCGKCAPQARALLRQECAVLVAPPLLPSMQPA